MYYQIMERRIRPQCIELPLGSTNKEIQTAIEELEGFSCEKALDSESRYGRD